MSPYLLQAPVFGATLAVALFATILIFCSVTDALRGDPPPGTKGWRVGVGIPGTADTRTARELLLAHAAVSTALPKVFCASWPRSMQHSERREKSGICFFSSSCVSATYVRILTKWPADQR